MAIALFAALGVWQIQRMHWKHALIASVNARLAAAPVALPPTRALGGEGATRLAYLRVAVSGTYRPRATALVRAATDYGTGYWAMTPLALDDGRTVWINRGFVPAGTRPGQVAAITPPGRIAVVGLLRADEPGGSLLQSNRPADDRWYSRDVRAMAFARGVGRVVPAFIDAQAETPPPPADPLRPIPGLTQVHFRDSHLSYALTWFALALLAAGGLVIVWRKSQWNG